MRGCAPVLTIANFQYKLSVLTQASLSVGTVEGLPGVPAPQLASTGAGDR